MNQPLVIADDNAPLESVQKTSNPGRRIRILLADDDVQTRVLDARVLVGDGYHVDIARDGDEAWKALNQAPYDLLITDYQMPKITGLELIVKLRSAAKVLPVILASGALPVEELHRHPDLKIEAKLQKPFTTALLLSTVRMVLCAPDGCQ